MRGFEFKSGPAPRVYCALAAMILLFLSLGIFADVALARTFSDTADHWAREPISQLSGLGVVNGYTDNSFRPDDSITRAEFARLMVGALGEEQEAKRLSGVKSAFADMETAHWALPYVMLGRELGLLQGAGGYYHPEAPISRQEAATILGRWLQDNGTAADSEPLAFTDMNEVEAWALPGLELAVAAELLNGFPDESFRPRDELSRAEAASLLSRMMDQAGRLYDFHGLLRVNDGKIAIISIGGEDFMFGLAEGSEFFLNGRRLEDISAYDGIRIAFNLNDDGYISFARLGSSADYLELKVSQYQRRQSDPLSRAEAPAAESMAAATAPADVNAEAATSLLAEDNAGAAANSNHEIGTIATQMGMERLYAGGLSGQGVTIAVIDSGIDTTHPSLQRTAQGAPKVIDWVNFSPEGTVTTNNRAMATADGRLETAGGPVMIPDALRSVSGIYRYGYWEEEWISYGADMDFTGNGARHDRILVLLSDQSVAGVYDTVLVDTDGDGELNDEMPLKVFRENRYNFASFPVSPALPQGFAFVLCDISLDGGTVSFGYDSAGHGTHVAGIVAASGEETTGMAPGAQLLAVKVANSAGYASLESLLNAVEYAVKKGADIINISLGYYTAGDAELESFRRRIDELAANTLIIAAAGNAGPGLGTLSSPGDVWNVLSVGACRMDGETGNRYTSRSGSLWHTSSVGPGQSGIGKPDLLAPATVVSTRPYWTGQSRGVSEGSSMAAALVSGTAAILIEDMYNKGRAFNGLMIRDALVGGAQYQAGLERHEQGHGLLNAQDSYSYLQKQKSFLRGSGLRFYAEPYGNLEGLIVRRYLPETLKLEINNPNQQEMRVSWSSDQSWLTPAREEMTLPATGGRSLELALSAPATPGIYTAILEGRFDDPARSQLRMNACLLVPEAWDQAGSITKSASLPASDSQHYWLAVDEEMTDLKLVLRMDGYIESLRGRARLYLYQPDGALWAVTDYAGRNAEGAALREVELSVDDPAAGLWEVVVYSAEDLAAYNLTRSEYTLTAEAGPLPSWQRVNSEFILGSALAQTAGGETTLHLYILERSTMLPYSGSLLINGRLYQVDRGRAAVTATAERNTVALELRRL